MIGSIGTAMAMAAVAAAGAGEPSPQVVRGTRGALSSSNTLYGPTGLITVPTAYVAADRAVQFSGSFGDGIRGPAANYGIIPGVEVGAAFLDRDGADDKVIANAKVNIVPQNFNWFEVGVGVIDAADAVGRSYYVIGSADLVVPDPLRDDAVGLRVHAGVGTGMFEEKLIGGGELTLDRERFSVVGEWNSDFFNAALRYVHDANFRIQAGFQAKKFFLGATHILRF